MWNWGNPECRENETNSSQSWQFEKDDVEKRKSLSPPFSFSSFLFFPLNFPVPRRLNKQRTHSPPSETSFPGLSLLGPSPSFQTLFPTLLKAWTWRTFEIGAECWIETPFGSPVVPLENNKNDSWLFPSPFLRWTWPFDSSEDDLLIAENPSESKPWIVHRPEGVLEAFLEALIWASVWTTAHLSRGIPANLAASKPVSKTSWPMIKALAFEVSNWKANSFDVSCGFEAETIPPNLWVARTAGTKSIEFGVKTETIEDFSVKETDETEEIAKEEVSLVSTTFC